MVAFIHGASSNGSGQVLLSGMNTRNTEPWCGTVAEKVPVAVGRSFFFHTSRTLTGPMMPRPRKPTGEEVSGEDMGRKRRRRRESWGEGG